MNAAQTPKISSDLIWRLLDDNAVIVSARSGQVRVLNGVGTVIWQLLTSQATLSEIERHLASHYDVSLEQASADVQAFLGELTERGLLVWDD